MNKWNDLGTGKKKSKCHKYNFICRWYLNCLFEKLILNRWWGASRDIIIPPPDSSVSHSSLHLAHFRRNPLNCTRTRLESRVSKKLKESYDLLKLRWTSILFPILKYSTYPLILTKFENLLFERSLAALKFDLLFIFIIWFVKKYFLTGFVFKSTWFFF